MNTQVASTPAHGAARADPVPNDVVSLHIAAPAERIYDLISNISNMGRWSPETYRTRWLGGATEPVVGARFRGYNRWRWVRWWTTVQIEAADRGQEFTFCTVFGRKRAAKWSYRFESDGVGTLVTETRTWVGRPLLAYTFQRVFMPGHEGTFEQGMLTTLQRIKEAAEAR